MYSFSKFSNYYIHSLQKWQSETLLFYLIHFSVDIAQTQAMKSITTSLITFTQLSFNVYVCNTLLSMNFNLHFLVVVTVMLVSIEFCHILWSLYTIAYFIAGSNSLGFFNYYLHVTSWKLQIVGQHISGTWRILGL